MKEHIKIAQYISIFYAVSYPEDQQIDYICIKFSKLELINRLNRSIRYFLLVLILVHIGCITLFTHTHHIENGVIVVHSHPFKSLPGKNPINHQHSSNGFVLIHLLSNISTTVSFSGLSVEAYKVFRLKIDFQQPDENFSMIAFLYSYGLRAPPSKYIS